MPKKQVRQSNEPEPMIRIRDTRSLPYLWITKAILRHPKINSRQLNAYTALAYYSDSGSGVTKIGIKQLAARVHISETTMKAGLKDLEKNGFIKVIKRPLKYPKGRVANLPNEYVLLEIEDNPRPATS